MTAFHRPLADAIAEKGVPLTADMARLSPEREAEIREHVATTTNWSLGNLAARDLLAELAAVRKERDTARAELGKYVGQEPTVDEEMAYLNGCLNAVYDLCDETKKQARRWEHPLPVPEWVAQVEQAADGQRAENPNDRRRRIYIDGKGNGWIDLSVDPGTGERELTGVTDAWKIATAAELRDDTGSLREIGRCW